MNQDFRNTRIVAHLDMDAFFAAVEERDHEWLRGLPIVVGADPESGKGRGVVATANYRAREYGIHSAMPITKAWRLSEEARKKGKPAAWFVGGRHQSYSEASRRIREIVSRYAKEVEQTSVDEMYIDMSFTGGFREAEKLALVIKRAICQDQSLTASVGIGPNKLIAKIASDFKKPNGLTVVPPGKVYSFLAPMSVRVLPGVGPKMQQALYARRIQTIEDLERVSMAELTQAFGKWGAELYRKSRGDSNSPVQESEGRKSISEQETLTVDTLDARILLPLLEGLCTHVVQIFKREAFTSFRTVGIMVRFADFETKTAARTLSVSAHTLVDLERETIKLFLPYLDTRKNPRKKLVRLLGVKVERLK